MSAYALSFLFFSNDTDDHIRPLNCSDTSGVFLSEPAAYRMSGSQYIQVPGYDGPREVWYETMSRQSPGHTLFPLHDVCLDMCRRAISDYQMKHVDIIQERDLTILTRLLNGRFRHRQMQSNVPDGETNDLFNLCTISETYGPQSVLAMSRLGWWGGEYEVKHYPGTYCSLGSANKPRNSMQTQLQILIHLHLYPQCCKHHRASKSHPG